MAIADGKIVAIGAVGTLPFVGAQVIDATGKHILPGWTDMYATLSTCSLPSRSCPSRLCPSRLCPSAVGPELRPLLSDRSS